MEEKADKQLKRTRSERQKIGKALRQEVPFSSYASWTPAVDRPNTINLLRIQDEGRLEKLLPIKYGRMLVSPSPFIAERPF